MNDRLPRYGEPHAFSELAPNPRVVDALRGVVSDPLQVVSHRPGSEGQLVTVRLAQEGPCMFGLTDWQDNREWAGIFNHSILTARYAVHLAEALQKKDTQQIPKEFVMAWLYLMQGEDGGMKGGGIQMLFLMQRQEELFQMKPLACS